MRQAERKLRKAGVNLSGIEFTSAREVEVYASKDGEFDEDLTQERAHEVAKTLGWGGFRTGYGSWILRKDYQDKGDWNDPSSRHHY